MAAGLVRASFGRERMVRVMAHAYARSYAHKSYTEGKPMRHANWLIVLAAAMVTAGHAADEPKVHPAITAAVESPDRPEADRKRDEGRRPAIVLEFFGVRPGQTLIEYTATGGVTAELLARTVGPKGKVYMQNSPAYYDFAGAAATKAVEERLANNRLPNVERLDKAPEDLGLPPNSVDGAVMNLVFHDMFWMSKDVPAIVANLYKTLKPGGWVGVVDHAAPAGTGSSYAADRKGQHRIDEDLTKKMFLDAGFKLDKESQMLRNPDDDRQKPFFAPEMKGKLTDRFALRFVKPKK
jgi:predicted methyltransferase